MFGRFAAPAPQGVGGSPAPGGPYSPGPRYIVAEVSFSRADSRDSYLRLGRALVECQRKFPWIDGIGGLEALLRGECPDHYSKAVGDGAGGFRPLFDPILVWGRGIHPGQAIQLLKREIPAELGQVGWPDP